MSHGVVPQGLAERARGGMAPLARRLVALGVTANAVTAAGFVVTLAGAALLATEQLPAAVAALVVGTLADTLDGALARVAGGGTRLGAFLDSTLDRLADAALFGAAAAVGAARGDGPLLWGSLGALVASFMVSYVRAKAESLGASARLGVAPREARVAIVLAGVAAWAAFGIAQLFTAAVLLVAALATLTLLQRVVAVAGALGSAQSGADQRKPS